jgi:hypothetical protein
MGSELGLQTQMAPMAKKEQEASKAFWVWVQRDAGK